MKLHENVMIDSRSVKGKKGKRLLRYLVYFVSFSTLNVSADLLVNAKVFGPVTNIYSISTVGEVEKITDNHRWRDIEPSISPTGDVVFSSNREGDNALDPTRRSEVYRVYIRRDKTGAVEQLTEGVLRDMNPQFNPSGNGLGYVSVRDKKNSQLRTLALDGGNEKIIVTADKILGFSWSPSGKDIVFSSVKGKRAQLAIVNVDSMAVTLVQDVPTEIAAATSEKNSLPVIFTSPVWSPDGLKLAYVKHPITKNESKSLYVFTLKSKNETLVSEKHVQVQDSVSWSNDSRRVLYSGLTNYRFYYDESTRDKVYEGGLHVFTSDLNGSSQQLTKGNHFHGHPVFSPNGESIAFLFAEKLGDARKLSLKTMTIDGGEQQELYTSVARDSKVLWR